MKERTRKTREIETTMKKQEQKELKFDVIFQAPKYEKNISTFVRKLNAPQI